MADDADIAQELEQLTREQALARHFARQPKPNGKCHFCGDPVAEAAHRGLFCDISCAQGYEDLQRSRERRRA